MKKIIFILLIPLVFSIHDVIAQNAPITTIGSVVTYGTTTVVPVTVTGFTNIGSCQLYLNFDPNIVTITSVSLGPGVSYFLWAEGVVSPGVYKIQWQFFQPFVPGLTLGDNSVFLNINCEKVAIGYSAIEFNNSSYDCLYGDDEYEEMNDTPTSTYYINGSITQLSETQWTGNTDNDWSTASNWSSGLPAEYRKAVIPDVLTNPYPSLSQVDGQCYVLEIVGVANLTIEPEGALTIQDEFINDGEITIKSTSVGDGSFIDGGNNSGSGAVNVERYLTSERWHYISPPVSGAVSGMFWDIYLTKWDEPSGTFSNITSIVNLSPMKGYGCWASDLYTGTTTVTYNATLNTGTQTAMGLTNTSTALHNSKGFNFVGNPYPSAVNWDEGTGWVKTNLDDAIYIWNPAAGQYGSYISGTSVNSVTNIIPGGQGFFIHVTTGNSTGSLQVNNKARLHSNKAFFKNSEGLLDEPSISLKLQISSTINSYYDQCFIKFDEFATENFDPSLDSYKILQGLIEAPNLYFISNDNVNLSINSLPSTEENQWIPLYCSIGQNGIYTIEAMQFDNCENKYVYLKDWKENIIINLKDQPSYSFYGDINDNTGRFQLMFLNSVIGINDSEANSRTIQIYSNYNEVFLVNGNNAFSGDLHIYDITGKQVWTRKLNSISSFKVKLNLEKGIYIVKFITDKSIITKKVHLTN